jgi:hypothetical protein
MIKEELLQGLKNQIEELQEGGVINLVDLIEDEGEEATKNLLIYLWNGVKNLNIRSAKVVNDIAITIVVYAK